MTDLKPCPFCGGEANTVLKGSDDWHIECHDCASRSGIYGIRESAIAAWNTRYHFGLKDEDYNILLDEMGIAKPERTCRREPAEIEDGLTAYFCSACDGLMYEDEPYCPNCGARVVSEDNDG